MYLYLYPIDRVGYKCAPTKETKYTGPLKPTEKEKDICKKHVWYNLPIGAVIFEKAVVCFEDGTQQILKYDDNRVPHIVEADVSQATKKATSQKCDSGNASHTPKNDEATSRKEDSPSPMSNIILEPFNTKVADFTMMLGHWKGTDAASRTWVENSANAAGEWILRWRISNKSEKTISELSLTVSLYNNEGGTSLESKSYHVSRVIKSGETHSVWCTVPCSNVVLKKGVLESVEIHFADGTVRRFSRF